MNVLIPQIAVSRCRRVQRVSVLAVRAARRGAALHSVTPHREGPVPRRAGLQEIQHHRQRY